ncbi:hypothetical protein ABVB41_10610 [Staphylococcus cohnii]
MVDTYKNKSHDMEKIQYMNLGTIVKGITAVYKDCDVKKYNRLLNCHCGAFI